MLGVNILEEFDAFSLLETSVDHGAEENGVLWLNDVFTGVSLEDMICADANIAYNVSGCVWQKHIFLPKMLFLQRVAHCRWWFLFNPPLSARWVQTVV